MRSSWVREGHESNERVLIRDKRLEDTQRPTEGRAMFRHRDTETDM